MIICGLTFSVGIQNFETDAAAAVSLSPSSVSVKEGGSKTIKVKAGKKVTIKKKTFVSKNKKIATVSAKGKVTGVKAGNTKVVVTVKYKKSSKKYTKKLTCPVKVKELNYKKYAKMTADEIVASLTLEQKAAQMVLPCEFEFEDAKMNKCGFGAVFGNCGAPEYKEWQDLILAYQKGAVTSNSGIPIMFGQDNVHGVNYCRGAVIFPQNIGIGAANDPELTYKMGRITADESRICHILWSFSPCVAQSGDPRWGRTYESYGSDLNIIKNLSTQFTKGLQDGGLIACPKHFFGDGNTAYGSGGEVDGGVALLDRGEATLTDAEIQELLSVYQAQIDAGAQSIMVSFSTLNGVKMHENKKYIEMLKNEMGFKGFIVSDYNAIQYLPKPTYYDKVVAAVNSGIDMLMEATTQTEAMEAIVKAVKNKDISKERMDDAVKRIIQVKLDEGVIADPFFKNLKTVQKETGSQEYRDVAEQLVMKSLVLMKNDKKVLPLKSGQKICVMGPASDNARYQCGGWTIGWEESPERDIPGVTTIKQGFQQIASEKGLSLVGNPSEADVIVLCIGEQSYAEWLGDAEDLDLCSGTKALADNKRSIDMAIESGKPIVACIVAGRNIYIDKYENDFDSVVMCYLPGSEGQGVAKMLTGTQKFTGKLPSNWYASNEDVEKKKAWKPIGYGLSE